jgi:VanZ family protein
VFSKVKIFTKLAIGWTILIIIGSLLPSAFIKIQALDSITGSDKILHITMYALAAYFWLNSIEKVTSGSKVIQIIILLNLLGFTMELLQSKITSGRFFEWYDAIANCIGTILGLMVYFLVNKNQIIR